MAKGTNFGKFIRLMRDTHRPPLTQRDLAQKLQEAGYGRAGSSVAHWENEKEATIPDQLKSPGFVTALAQILDTTPWEIYRAAGFLDGLELPDNEQALFLKALDQLSPEDRQRWFDVGKAMFPDKF